jgi:hypothetical protein
MDDSVLDPLDEALAPLAQSIGRAVIGAVAPEKVLVVDIANRVAQRDGLRQGLERELGELERRPGGKVLEKLKELGLDDALAARVLAAIVRRNRLIHHYMEDPKVMLAFMTGAGIDEFVADVDSLAIECQQIINLLAHDAFTGLLHTLGADIPALIDTIANSNLSQVDDPKLRQQLKALQELDPAQLRELLDDAQSDIRLD